MVAAAAVVTQNTSRFNYRMISQSTRSSTDNDNSTDKDNDNNNNNESNTSAILNFLPVAAAAECTMIK